LKKIAPFFMLESQFYSFLENEKRYSPHTVSSYRNDLTQFLTFAKEEYEITKPEEVTHLIVRSWVVDLMERDYNPNSIHRKISTLRTYFKFLIQKECIKLTPMSRVQAPKASKRLPSFVENKAMQDLFSKVTFEDGFAGTRDEMLMRLLYETGMRLSELIGLKHGDADAQRMALKVLGKRNKERLIPLSPAMFEALDDYKKGKESEGFTTGFADSLLVTDKGENLYPKFVRRKVNRYLSLVTTLDKKSPHILRHTFATHMLNNGADLNAVKELLGHASLVATQVYTHNTIEKLKSIHEQAHPRG
jgi:integrase/recombinase XerC